LLTLYLQRKFSLSEK